MSLIATEIATRWKTFYNGFVSASFLEAKNLDLFVNSFKDGFYCDRDAVKEALEGPIKMFNIIDNETNYKADFVVLKDDPFRQEEFKRRLKVAYFGKTVYVVSPEDLLISKLIWIKIFNPLYR